MRLFKKGNIYYIDYSDASGKRHRESTGTGNKKLAEQIAAKREVETLEHKKMGIKPVRSVMLSDFIGEYLAMAEANKVPAAVTVDRIALKNLLEKVGDKSLDEIDEGDIERYKIERLKEIAPATVHREMNTIKNMFRIAHRRNQTKRNPTKFVKKPQEPPGRVRYLSKDEIPLLLKECKKNPYLYLFVIIALNTGMRKGEILGLKWEDIDFENNLIHLEKTKNRERADILMNDPVVEELNHYRELIDSPLFTMSSIVNFKVLMVGLKDPKHPYERRIRDFLTQKFRDKIDRYKSDKPIGKSIKKLVIDEFNNILDNKDLYETEIFSGLNLNKEEKHSVENGLENMSNYDLRKFNRLLFEKVYPHEIEKSQFMDGKSSNRKVFPILDLKKGFGGALERAKIKDFRIHDLRHTFASYLAMNNIPLTVIKELMRHKDFKMTLRYAHLSPTQKRDAVNKLAQIWHT